MIFHAPKGVIALDIDGTITSQTHQIHPDVVQYLTSLQEDGWNLIFITGRPFQWGYEVLRSLKHPYAFAVQNGALILDMPARKTLLTHYLNQDSLPLMEQICREEGTDFIIYAGFENQDWCYYRPTHLPSSTLEYVQKRFTALQEKWQALPSFQSLPVSTFSSYKCFAQGQQAKRLSERFEKELKLHAPINRDPFDPSYSVIQATHPNANKGTALKLYKQRLMLTGVVIAAGDDYNDLSMLQTADIRVVMNTAPRDLQEIADILAPSAVENGIIKGLTEAIHRANRQREGLYA